MHIMFNKTEEINISLTSFNNIMHNGLQNTKDHPVTNPFM